MTADRSRAALATLAVALLALPLACVTTVRAERDAAPADVTSFVDVVAPVDVTSPPDALVSVDAPDATSDTPVDVPVVPPIDRPPPSCPGRTVLDLDVIGTTTAGVTRYAGTVPSGGTPLAMWGCNGAFQAAVFRATVRIAGRIGVSSDNPATAVAVFDGCPDQSPPALSCRFLTVSPSAPLVPAVSPARSFAAGDVVYVVIGAGSAGVHFELSMGAARPSRRDDLCDIGGEDACEDGTACAYVSAEGVHRCAPHGVGGQPCRAGDPALACDPGLSCTALYRTCRTALPRDATCDPITDTCAAGQSCVPDLDSSGTWITRCRDDGASGGRCRSTLPRCDSETTCTGVFCQRPLDLGAPCAGLRRDWYCGETASCPASVCVADGALGGRCRTVGTPCDAGASCARVETARAIAMCRRPVADGERCELTGVLNACPDGQLCVRDGFSSRCAVAGTEGVPCRVDGSPCGAGLQCTVRPGSDGLRRCRPLRLSGDACDGGELGDSCVAGTRCGIAEGTARRCIADGARGGACRAAGAACDVGLGCGVDVRCQPGAAVGERCAALETCNGPLSCMTSPDADRSYCALASYSMERAPDEEFIDACDGGTRLFGALSAVSRPLGERVVLPFVFRAYGREVREVRVFTSGAVSLGPEPHALLPSGGGGNFPWLGASVPLVAAFWEYVYPRLDGVSGVCVRTVGIAPNRRTVIGWKDVRLADDDSAHLTFALMLHEGTGLIDVRYAELREGFGGPWSVNGTNAAIGVHDRAGFDSTRHRARLVAPLAIRFAPR